MFSTPSPELAALNETPSNNSPSEPGVENDNKPGRPGLASRSHLENQERAYVAASRRSDRPLDARYQSAKMASKIHKDRTGKAFKLSKDIVQHEEMYEEEDSEMSSMKLLDTEARAASNQLSEKLDSWIQGKNTVMNLIANSQPQERYDMVNQIFSHTYPAMAAESAGHGQPFDPRPPTAAQMMRGSQSQHGIQAQQGVQGQQGVRDQLDFQSRYRNRMMQSARATEGQQFGRDSQSASRIDGLPAARPSSPSPTKSASSQRPRVYRAGSTPNLCLSNSGSPLGSLDDAAFLGSNNSSTPGSHHGSFFGIGREQNSKFGMGTGGLTPGTPMNEGSGADTFTGALPYATAMLLDPGGLPEDVREGLSGQLIGTAVPAMPVPPSQERGFLGGPSHMETGQQQHGGQISLYDTPQAQNQQQVPGGPVYHPQHAQGQGPTRGLQQSGVMPPQNWAQKFDRQIQASQAQPQLQQQQIQKGLEHGYVDQQLDKFIREKELEQRRRQVQSHQMQLQFFTQREQQKQEEIRQYEEKQQRMQQRHRGDLSQQSPFNQQMERVMQVFHKEEQQKKLERQLRLLLRRQERQKQKQKQQQQQQQHQMELGEEQQQLPQGQVQQDKRRKGKVPRVQPQQSPQQKSRVQKPKSQQPRLTQQMKKMQHEQQLRQIRMQMQETLQIREQQSQEQSQEQAQSPQTMSKEPQEQQQPQPYSQPEQQQGLPQQGVVDEEVVDEDEDEEVVDEDVDEDEDEEVVDEVVDEDEDELESFKKPLDSEPPSGGSLGGESAEQAVPDLDDEAWNMFINDAIFTSDDL